MLEEHKRSDDHNQIFGFGSVDAYQSQSEPKETGCVLLNFQTPSKDCVDYAFSTTAILSEKLLWNDGLTAGSSDDASLVPLFVTVCNCWGIRPESFGLKWIGDLPLGPGCVVLGFDEAGDVLCAEFTSTFHGIHKLNADGRTARFHSNAPVRFRP